MYAEAAPKAEIMNRIVRKFHFPPTMTVKKAPADKYWTCSITPLGY
jgi:hypothetical protein